jgi:hypothetical protein
MDAGKESASIAIELSHPDATAQEYYFEQLQQLKTIFQESVGEDWDWQLLTPDENGNPVSRVEKKLEDINIFWEEDWPAIISFLKPRIIALDNFWMMVKDSFETGI